MVAFSPSESNPKAHRQRALSIRKLHIAKLPISHSFRDSRQRARESFGQFSLHHSSNMQLSSTGRGLYSVNQKSHVLRPVNTATFAGTTRSFDSQYSYYSLAYNLTIVLMRHHSVLFLSCTNLCAGRMSSEPWRIPRRMTKQEKKSEKELVYSSHMATSRLHLHIVGYPLGSSSCYPVAQIS